MTIFSEMDSRLSVVKRWTVINTIQTQSVAEHCFNVERIARRIAMEWLRIKDPVILDQISQAALHHDDGESETGDIPAPAKHVLKEEYLDEQRRLWSGTIGGVGGIIKLADKMEAYWFMAMESQLGNRYIENYRNELYHRIVLSADGLNIQKQIVAWLLEMNSLKGTTRGPTIGSTTEGAASSQGKAGVRVLARDGLG